MIRELHSRIASHVQVSTPGTETELHKIPQNYKKNPTEIQKKSESRLQSNLHEMQFSWSNQSEKWLQGSYPRMKCLQDKTRRKRRSRRKGKVREGWMDRRGWIIWMSELRMWRLCLYARIGDEYSAIPGFACSTFIHSGLSLGQGVECWHCEGSSHVKLTLC